MTGKQQQQKQLVTNHLSRGTENCNEVPYQKGTPPRLTTFKNWTLKALDTDTKSHYTCLTL